MPSLRTSRGLDGVATAILGALAIVVGSSLLGLLVNRYSPHGIPLLAADSGEEAAPTLPMPDGVTSIDLSGVRSSLERGDALILDARPSEDYAEAHIPGALSLPANDFDSRFPEVSDSIERATRIIVYCSGVECSDSIEVAGRLSEFRFRNISVFEQGFRAWAGSGLPTEQGAPP
jgi:rhodanese-related sulfurtransferase